MSAPSVVNPSSYRSRLFQERSQTLFHLLERSFLVADNIVQLERIIREIV